MSIIIKPIISEKMSASAEKFNRYGFIVDRKATKTQVKKAVQDIYDVKVEKVNTYVQRGKSTVRNTKSGAIPGQKNTVKKAIVFLNEKDKIDIFSNI